MTTVRRSALLAVVVLLTFIAGGTLFGAGLGAPLAGAVGARPVRGRTCPSGLTCRAAPISRNRSRPSRR